MLLYADFWADFWREGFPRLPPHKLQILLLHLQGNKLKRPRRPLRRLRQVPQRAG